MQANIAFDTMEKLIPHMSAIINDASGAQIIKNMRDNRRPAGSVMAELLPLFLGSHRENLYGIISVLSHCSIEEAKEMDIKDVNKILAENFVEDMLLFFVHCLKLARCM